MAFHRRLYRVARQLRYRELPELIGRSVVIPSVDQVEATVMRCFELGPPINLLGRFEATAAKYGLLDLEFTSLQSTLTLQDRGGVALLKQLSFVKEDRTEENLRNEEFCLQELEESISGRELVKLFLISDLDLDSNPLRAKGFLQRSALPRAFRVTDACLTNSDYVWFNKHFYF
jgi:hypothetical protein